MNNTIIQWNLNSYFKKLTELKILIRIQPQNNMHPREPSQSIRHSQPKGLPNIPT